MDEQIHVVGLGAGGHAKVILDILSYHHLFKVVGLTDSDPRLFGSDLMGVPILGTDAILPRLRREGVASAFIGLGSTGDSSARRRLFELARDLRFTMINTIHPSAIVARSVRTGHGVSVMAAAVLNPAVTVGDNVIINTGAQIDHDCHIGDHVHIAPGAHLSGNVTVNTGAHIGVGATVIQGLHVGAGAIVGAGTVVLRDVPPNVTVFGVPARVIEKRE